MGDIAIQVQGLGKEYHIGGPQKNYDRLGEQVVEAVKAPFRRAKNLLRGQATGAAELNESFWALKDTSFKINHGEVVGIIGRNGAGKSTLLKILSRITDPTEGRAVIYGRVGSLLEVGTGFHPELTGRENIFLNGAILGMRRHEITRKFDEIVAFADIGPFIDTPVKHYSSGMYVRLAFSVAAHLETEILLIDEVLAVGDVAFQRKCLGKMDNVARQGRTVLFVSHNMGLMQTLCRRGIFLQNGRLVIDDTINQAVDAYLRTLEHLETQNLAERTDRQGVGQVKLVAVEVNNGDTSGASVLKTGASARFVFRLNGTMSNMACMFVIYDQLGHAIANFKSDVPAPDDTINPEMGATYVCELDELMLLPGRYRINVLVQGGGEWQDRVEAAAIFNVERGHLQGRPVTPAQKNTISACMPHRWIKPV